MNRGAESITLSSSAQLDTHFAAIRQGDAAPSTLPLKLSMLGKTQTIMSQVSQWKQQGDKAMFDLSFDLSLRKSDIKVPSVLLFIRVG
ncbi:MAG: hypothetical protein WAW39_21045 [Prosthecobacter sp.]|uniref:hypothetical protein n=1 Tax=Prosthecobacter sp. TaxID=1965333 RepID=UPI003BB0CA34